MPYATYADLVNMHDERFIIELSDDNGDGIADPAVVAEAISKADAEINARVAQRYTVPMTPVPALAVSLSATLAIGMLYSRRGMARPDTVKEDVAAAIRLLDRIGEGRAAWGDATEPAADRSAVDVRISSQARIFSRTSMKGF